MKIVMRLFKWCLLIVLCCLHVLARPALVPVVSTYDICVYGGTSAGVMAAVAAKRMGKKVLLIEPGYRLGGLSSGGLGFTDIGNKYAVTGLARQFYRRLGQHYGNFENWIFEPHVAENLFRQYIREEGIQVLYGYRLSKLVRQDRRIRFIRLENTSKVHPSLQVAARVFIDCSYEGDLMAKAGVSYTIGREDNRQYGETLNGVQLRDKHQFPDGVDPYRIPGDSTSGLLWGISAAPLAPNGTGDQNVQAYNFRICLTDSVPNQIPIARPRDYDSTRYELLLRLIEKKRDYDLGHYMHIQLMPHRKTDINNNGAFSTDMIGMSNQYPDADHVTRQKIFQQHMDYTVGLLYFLGHDPRVPDTMRRQMLRWGYPKDEYKDTDHFTPQLYVREARRMIGEYVMTEHNCRGTETVSDPIALAAYTMDSHNCQRIVVNGMVKNEGDVQVGGFPPYPISYRALTPRRAECTNLLVPVCLSASHIAYGSIRMEPVFMVLGQVSGVAAAMAIEKNGVVQEVSATTVYDLLKKNPLLDGSTPEVLVDDADIAEADRKGHWEKKTAFMHTYKSSYLLCEEADQAKASLYFRPAIPRKGRYNIYFYCTDLNQPLPTNIVLLVHHAKGTSRVHLNADQHKGSWANAGCYELNAGREAYVEIRNGSPKIKLIADAILFVPIQSNKRQKID